MGTAYSIQYQCVVQDDPTNAEVIPIVFVHMDEFRGQSCYTDIERVVPFPALSSHMKINSKYIRWQPSMTIIGSRTCLYCAQISRTNSKESSYSISTKNSKGYYVRISVCHDESANKNRRCDSYKSLKNGALQ